MVDYRSTPQTCDSSVSLLKELNDFFTLFKENNNSTPQSSPLAGEQAFTLSPDSVDVLRTTHNVPIRLVSSRSSSTQGEKSRHTHTHTPTRMSDGCFVISEPVLSPLEEDFSIEIWCQIQFFEFMNSFAHTGVSKIEDRSF